MTTNRAQKLKYLGIEMLKKDATKSSTPEVGLFRGIRERSDDTAGATVKSIKLILLGTKDRENDLKALNLAVFNVLSIKMLYGDTKELIVLKNNEEDQAAAIEILTEALAEFRTEKRMVDNDPEIIDVSTFEDVPQEFFAPKETKAASAATSYGYGNNYSNPVNNNSNWQEKQKEREEEKERQEKLRWTPAAIGRKGELPAVKVLNAIKKKVVAIATGDYEECFKDPDPKDTFTEAKKTSAAKP